MNKNLLTNIITISLVIIGIVIKNNIILNIGLFALSGAITNSIAIHMLFQKVPLLYGSGVIENRFEEFKISIRKLIMEQFFTKENLQKFFSSKNEDSNNIDLSKLIEKTDFSVAFESLKSAVMDSSFGGMLGMFGGDKALEPLKEPFELKIKSAIVTIANSEDFQNRLKKTLGNDDISHKIKEKIEVVVLQRLEELDAKMVKNIILDMLKEHLGWLVVWGGFFGGLIGLFDSFLI